MKAFVRSLMIAAWFAALGYSPGAFAYHDGGVAYCDGCHTMHNSKGGVAVKGTQFQGQPYLLQGSDQSSTCLNCHASSTGGGYHIMTFPIPAAGQAPVQLTPGGDFAYLSKTYTGVLRGAPWTSAGERHGHNVIAVDYGLVPDSTLATSPGGSYSASHLMCISCHDPHSNARIVDGNGTIQHAVLGSKTLPISGSGSYGAQPTATDAVGVYRLLAGKNYVPDSYPGGPAFTTDPPIAVAPSTYNRTEAATDTRVAYGTGMSEWCANCHAAIHNDQTANNTQLIHPAGAGALLSASTQIAGNPTTIAAIYNAYKSSGDLSGTQATSYTSLVPYEEGSTNTSLLATHASNSGAYTAGPSTGTENVMCLTCHRAHASGFNQMTRWNNEGELVTLAGAWPGTDSANTTAQTPTYATGKTVAEYTAAMYNHPATQFATYQRSLCNKCHAKD
jgi:hypothetical protein